MCHAELSDGSTLFVFGSCADVPAHASSRLEANTAVFKSSSTTEEGTAPETLAEGSSSDEVSLNRLASIPATAVELSGADTVDTEHPEETAGAPLESYSADAADGGQHAARTVGSATDIAAIRPSNSPPSSNMPRTVQSRDSLAEMKVSASANHTRCLSLSLSVTCIR